MITFGIILMIVGLVTRLEAIFVVGVVFVLAGVLMRAFA